MRHSFSQNFLKNIESSFLPSIWIPSIKEERCPCDRLGDVRVIGLGDDSPQRGGGEVGCRRDGGRGGVGPTGEPHAAALLTTRGRAHPSSRADSAPRRSPQEVDKSPSAWGSRRSVHPSPPLPSGGGGGGEVEEAEG